MSGLRILDEHDIDWIGYVEDDDEYAAHCLCGYRVTAWAEDAAEQLLQSHIDNSGASS